MARFKIKTNNFIFFEYKSKIHVTINYFYHNFQMVKVLRITVLTNQLKDIF